VSFRVILVINRLFRLIRVILVIRIARLAHYSRNQCFLYHQPQTNLWVVLFVDQKSEPYGCHNMTSFKLGLYCFISFRPSVRPSKIFFVAFFSATIDGRNLIFGHKLHIFMPYCGKRFCTRQIPT
jgi:hypothetical protein